MPKAGCLNRKSQTKSTAIGFGTVFAALQHTGPMGAVRAVLSACALLKKEPKATHVWRFQPRAKTLSRRLRRRPANRQGLSRAPPRRGKVSSFHPPARDRCAAISDRRRDGRMILPRAPLPSLIPESAPFSAEQRVWLNGLFAGLLSLERGVTPLSLDQAAALLPGALDLAASATPTSDDDDGAPWHDPAMPLADRMKLAEGRPLPRRMMAAMGQQDCGQCGYNCQDYSDAIFLKKEERLNLCVPGGKETTRMLKALHQDLGEAPVAAATPTPTPAAATVAPAAAPGCSHEC